MRATKYQQKTYGSIYYDAPPPTDQQTEDFERNGDAPISIMFLPQYDPSKMHHFHINVIWYFGPRRVQLIPLQNVLSQPNHAYFLQQELKENQVKAAYSDPSKHRIVSEFIDKYIECNYTSHNDLKLEYGYLVKVTGADIEFAQRFPFAKILQIQKLNNIIVSIEIIHQKSENEQIINVNGSKSWICASSISEVICPFNNQDKHFAAYTKQQLLRSRQRCKEYKSDHLTAFQELLNQYFGTRISKKLTNKHFKMNRKGKQMVAEQDMSSTDVNTLLLKILNKNKISYSKTEQYLLVSVPSATKLACVIGGNNVMNIEGRYEYFLIYPLQIKYGYQWAFPKLQMKFDVGRVNASKNIER